MKDKMDLGCVYWLIFVVGFCIVMLFAMPWISEGMGLYFKWVVETCNKRGE